MVVSVVAIWAKLWDCPMNVDNRERRKRHLYGVLEAVNRSVRRPYGVGMTFCGVHAAYGLTSWLPLRISPGGIS